jgi:DNA-binding NarL/FixJ family response regulator
MPLRILIVDDHEVIRQGVRSVFREGRPDWEICGEATNGKEAIHAARALHPDVILLDITMPVMSGLEAAKEIVALGCRVLIFTMHESAKLADDVRRSGAQGYVQKSQAARDLILAIENIVAGGTFFGSPEIQPKRKDQQGSPLGIFLFKAFAFNGSR